MTKYWCNQCYRYFGEPIIKSKERRCVHCATGINNREKNAKYCRKCYDRKTGLNKIFYTIKNENKKRLVREQLEKFDKHNV